MARPALRGSRCTASAQSGQCEYFIGAVPIVESAFARFQCMEPGEACNCVTPARILHRFGRCSKKLMDAFMTRGYLLADTHATESFGVELGPLPTARSRGLREGTNLGLMKLFDLR